MINRLIDLALSRRLLTVFVVALLSVVGLLVYSWMPKDIYPDLNAPLVTVITENTGMASEDVERLITLPLESLLSGAPGVTRVRSESSTGDSVVTVEFDWGTDIYLARQIVSSKLELVTGRLPEGTSAPILGPVSSRMGEVFEFVVVGDESTDAMQLRSVADWTIRYRLQGVQGVSFIVNLGGFVRQFQAQFNPELMRHHAISVEQLRSAIQQGNRNFSGGIVTKGTQEILVKGVGRIETLEHLRDIVVTARDGVPVRVRDVAEVVEGAAFRREDAGHNGRDAVYVTLEKQYGGDTLTAIANVKEALGRLGRDLPPGVAVKVFYDQSILITKSLQHVGIAVAEGIALVVLVMLVFMGSVRGALIASLTIPFSVLIALILMHLAGIQLTVMSIGGLAIGIGKVANGSIIMVENIYRILRSTHGEAPVLDLTSEAAKEVGGYLFSASLVIMLVFLPLLTLEGIEGAMFRPTAFAVAAALFGALVLNLTLQPVLVTLALKVGRLRSHASRASEAAERFFRRWLPAMLDRKVPLLTVFLIVVGTGAGLSTRLGSEFVPPLDENAILASTVMLPETSLEESVRIGGLVERALMEVPEVVSVSRTTGSAESSEHVHPVGHSHYNVELVAREDRERGFEDITEDMRRRIETIPGIGFIFEQPIANKLAEMLTGSEGELVVKLFGPDLSVLNDQVEHLREVLESVQGVEDLQVEQTSGIPQLVIEVDRERLSRFGISVDQVADVVETALNGLEATQVYEADRVTAVFVRLPERYRSSDEEISRLLVDSPDGQPVPLSAIARIRRDEGPQTIFREDLQRRKIIRCNVSDRDIVSFVQDAQRTIAGRVPLPPGYYVTFGGQFESQQRAMQHLLVLGAVVIMIIFVVLFASLGSVWQAALIVANVPATLAGAVIGLWIAGQTLNVSSMIGLIALFGVCAQNDIILVGRINDLRRAGVPLRQAVVKGAVDKFRAIFMTDLVMIVSVLPLALSNTTGSELHRPLAIVYIGGFLFALVLRLFVVPAMYEGLARLCRASDRCA
ncbi:MAG: efflux RND transporter permease subunit [Acidobacteriota bacterium]